jgi:hypothetical protein
MGGIVQANGINNTLQFINGAAVSGQVGDCEIIITQIQ